MDIHTYIHINGIALLIMNLATRHHGSRHKPQQLSNIVIILIWNMLQNKFIK